MNSIQWSNCPLYNPFNARASCGGYIMHGLKVAKKNVVKEHEVVISLSNKHCIPWMDKKFNKFKHQKVLN
jgi:hypothetical protein